MPWYKLSTHNTEFAKVYLFQVVEYLFLDISYKNADKESDGKKEKVIHTFKYSISQEQKIDKQIQSQNK